jgi:hypothetical protein
MLVREGTAAWWGRAAGCRVQRLTWSGCLQLGTARQSTAQRIAARGFPQQVHNLRAAIASSLDKKMFSLAERIN